MIIKAFLNAAGVNSLLNGGSAEGRSRPDKDFLIETLIETHEYGVSPADDAANGIAYFTFTARRGKTVFNDMAAIADINKVAKAVVAPEPKLAEIAKAQPTKGPVFES